MYGENTPEISEGCNLLIGFSHISCVVADDWVDSDYLYCFLPTP